MNALTGQLVHFTLSANLNDSGIGGTATFAKDPTTFKASQKSDEQVMFVPACIFESKRGTWSGVGAEMIEEKQRYNDAAVREGRMMFPTKAMLQYGQSSPSSNFT